MKVNTSSTRGNALVDLQKKAAIPLEFFAEIEEMLEHITVSLAQIERQEHSSETLHAIYRDTHTIKGTAQLFGCQQMGQLAHAMETSLEPIRTGKVQLNHDLVDALYGSIDVVKKLLQSLRNSGTESSLHSEVQNFIALLAERTSQSILGNNNLTKDAPRQQEEHSPMVEKEKPSASIPSKAEASNKSEESRQEQASNETIRVQIGLLDSLMNLVGELVLIRNQVMQHINSSTEDAEFINLSQRLNIVTTELQNEVMKTRMQPIGNILSKFHRIVRDLSRELGKEITLKLEGTETELDKTLIEAVKDPLTHIVRNSVDHGIEMPQARTDAGKSPGGQILIRSFHEGGQIVIEVSDDGKGLHRQRIGDKALEKGLVTADNLRKMSDREVHQLIFAPGFSTAEKVSNISGRGVGMDVVRTNIEKIGGVVDLSSIEGGGTCIRIKIPLTLAIVPALIVNAGGECFAIPQVKLTELVRVEHQGDKDGTEILQLQGQPFVKLRGKLLPLLSLKQLLKLEDDSSPASDITNIAILKADAGLFGLAVDSIEDSTDIVVKPLNAFLKKVGIYSGATVLGDGSVALVLDVIGIATHAALFEGKAQDAKDHDGKNSQGGSYGSLDDFTEYLVVDVGIKGRYALPLVLVSRLEEFSKDMIEISGEQAVVRYRGSILPLISVSKQLGFAEQKELEGPIPVVVVERGGRQFGLEVRSIIDVIGLTAPIDNSIKDRDCILGTIAHTDSIVVILDAYTMIEKAFPALKAKVIPISTERDIVSERSRHHILLAEDNGFFRRQITEILTQAGYRVSAEANGEDALKRLETMELNTFSAIVSDIEMPKMTGLQFAERVRGSTRFRSMLMIALSSKSRESMEKDGIKAGFDCYLEKLEARHVVSELDSILGIGKERKYGT